MHHLLFFIIVFSLVEIACSLIRDYNDLRHGKESFHSRYSLEFPSFFTSQTCLTVPVLGQPQLLHQDMISSQQTV